MIRLAGTSLLVALLFIVSANAQTQGLEIEKGSARELKGVHKVFIFANENDKKAIVAVIKQKLPLLTIVGTADTADVWMIFRVRNPTFPANSAGSGFETAGSTTAVDYEITATGEVLKSVSAVRARSLVQFSDSRRFMYETDMAARFAKNFVDSYRKAN